MILGSTTQYYCIKTINGVVNHLCLSSFKFFPGIDFFMEAGATTKEDLQFFMNKFVSKENLEGSEIVAVKTIKVMYKVNS